MTLNRRNLILVATLGSAALLAGAFMFQAMGYAPCKMCYWQRWPHGAAIAAGALALLTGGALWMLAGALSALVTGAIGVFHAGVELKYWPGPQQLQRRRGPRRAIRRGPAEHRGQRQGCHV